MGTRLSSTPLNSYLSYLDKGAKNNNISIYSSKCFGWWRTKRRTFFDHSRSGLLITDISDHLPVFSIHSNNDSSNSDAHDPVVIRDNNKENLASFLETLKQITWSSLDGYHDPKKL